MTESIGMLELVLTAAVILGTAFGLWVNLNNECTKLKGRVYHLEQTDSELKIILAEIISKLQHIELLLAENKIKIK